MTKKFRRKLRRKIRPFVFPVVYTILLLAALALFLGGMQSCQDRGGPTGARGVQIQFNNR